ncbi:thioredoxin domain-containing protein [Nocardioides dubius]|uniref:Thioredoxin domain-containing protein n=1 Tax=Nocardioides dubius TaxID=317019 RepID=A0ABN1TQ85_9ACTN
MGLVRAQTKLAAIVAALIVLTVGFVWMQSDDGPKEASTAAERSALVRPDSRILGEKGDGKVTFVEFLDFECEGCRAAYPYVEEMREKYGDEVTFVVRYFPMRGHFNSERAARSVESAARQGKFEAMYAKMFATQEEWGEQRKPLDDLFRGFAEELGLDMAVYDADYSSTEVKERIQRDIADGESLEVRGTPTFYVNGKPFQPQYVEDFEKVLDEALGR